MNNVPFTPRVHWSFSPFGYFVGGVSTSYSLDVFRSGDDVLRIQRVLDPTPVDAAEKDAARMGIIRGFRQYAPDWQWNGPGIPDLKPAFQDITVGRDGRIWVQLHQPGYLAEPADPSDPSSADQWAEPVIWDVFEPDGTDLGRITGPEGFQTGPEPVFDGDHVWAITTDDLDVEYLTRFRIARAGAGPEADRTNVRYPRPGRGFALRRRAVQGEGQEWAYASVPQQDSPYLEPAC